MIIKIYTIKINFLIFCLIGQAMNSLKISTLSVSCKSGSHQIDQNLVKKDLTFVYWL